MNRFPKYQGAISDARPQIGGDLFGIMVLVILLGIFSLSGCQDSFMKQTTADKTSAIASLTSEVDAAGNVTATFDPNSSQTQVLQLNSGSIAGAAVAIPPGSLSIPVSVVVGEGESLASSSFSQQIGLTDNAIAASGPSVSFIPSQNVQATNPFTLAIPFSAVTALSLKDAAVEENLVVMFRSIKVENGTTSYREGVIPREQITVSKDKVTFQTTNFGLFQVGVAQTKVREKIEKPAAQPPALIAEVGSPLIGVWGRCEAAKSFPDPATVKIPDGFFGTKPAAGLSLYNPPMDSGGLNGGNTTGTPIVNSEVLPPEPPYIGFVSPSVNPTDSRLVPINGIEGGFPMEGRKVQAIEFWKDELFVGGSFSKAGPNDALGLARLDPVTRNWLPPVSVPVVGGQLPLASVDSKSFVSSMVATNDALYLAGRFAQAFGAPNANNLVKLTKNADSTFAAESIGGTPISCEWISDMRRHPVDGSLFVVCNKTVRNTSVTPQVFKTTSQIWRVNPVTTANQWVSRGPEFGGDLPEDSVVRSAIQSFDVNDVTVSSVQETVLVASVLVNGGRKIVRLVRDPSSNGGSVEQILANDTGQGQLTIRLFNGLQLLIGGYLRDGGNGIVKLMNFSSTPMQISDLIEMDVQGPITAMTLNNISPNDIRLAVGSFGDLQIFKLGMNAGVVTASRMMPSNNEIEAGNRTVGPKVAIVRNLKDTSTKSYFVAGMMDAKTYVVPPVIPPLVLDMVGDGEQWFGRVSGQVYSKRESLRFKGSEVFHTTEYFKSKDCTGALVSSKTESGAYALPEVDVSGTIPIHMKFYKASGKIVGGDWFKSLNRAERYIGSCGVSDWQLGEERDLPADKTCFSPFKVSPRMQVVGDELQICGAKEEDILSRPEDCAEILQTFKRPPKR